MTRDDDFLRELLLEIERSDGPFLYATISLGASPDALKRWTHAELLSDAGFLKSVNSSSYRMTNQGHDFLNTIRHDNAWNKVKAGAVRVGGVTLGMMRDLAAAYLKQQIAQNLGVQI